MKFECGAGSRWTSTTDDSDGDVCNFSGCNCGTLVRKVGETEDRYENWFGLRVVSVKPAIERKELEAE